MDIKSVLDERIICTELDAVDKEDALKKMIKMLLDAGYIDDAEGFYEDVLLRESQGIISQFHMARAVLYLKWEYQLRNLTMKFNGKQMMAKV